MKKTTSILYKKGRVKNAVSFFRHLVKSLFLFFSPAKAKIIPKKMDDMMWLCRKPTKFVSEYPVSFEEAIRNEMELDTKDKEQEHNNNINTHYVQLFISNLFISSLVNFISSFLVFISSFAIYLVRLVLIRTF